MTSRSAAYADGDLTIWLFTLLHCGLLDGPTLPAPLASRMTPRRSRYAPKDESRTPHWLVTYDVYRNVLASKCLPVGTNLQAAMQHAIKEHEANGWTMEKNGAYGFFFCNRGGERREVRMQSTDPSQPIPLNNTSPFGA